MIRVLDGPGMMHERIVISQYATSKHVLHMKSCTYNSGYRSRGARCYLGVIRLD